MNDLNDYIDFTKYNKNGELERIDFNIDIKTKTVFCDMCRELMYNSTKDSIKGKENHFYCDCGYTKEYKFILNN